jgi:hypothetical protein
MVADTGLKDSRMLSDSSEERAREICRTVVTEEAR